jgi:hypothetical protein
MGGSVVGVQFERASHKLSANRRVANGNRGQVWESSQIKVIGVEAFRALSPRTIDLQLAQAWLDDADHFVSNLILQLEDIFQPAVEFLGPKMRPGFGLEGLRRDAQARACFAHAALQEVPHAKLAPDLAHVDGLSLRVQTQWSPIEF